MLSVVAFQLQAQSFLIESIQIKSQQLTLPPDAILAAAGLKKGQSATVKEVEDAARRLVDTGYISFANFSYQTKEASGVQVAALTFDVTEAARTMEVLLDFPNLDQAALFKQLAARGKFFTGTMPPSDAATQLALKEIEEVVGAPVDTTLENDLHTRKSTLVFHLRYSPQIQSIEVSGNRTVSTATVLGTITRLAVGQPYSDRRFRGLVEMNVRPVYERLGRLAVQFRWLPPVIQENAVIARFEVDEGQLYRIGSISMAGEAVDPGKMLQAGEFAKGIANWEEIERAARRTLEPLRSQGYIAASARIIRNLRPEAGLMDLTIDIKKAQQFIFGGLKIDGLPESDQLTAQKNLQLKVGEPYNEVYLREYLRDFLSIISNKNKGLTQELLTRPGTNLIDLVWKFK